MIQISGGSSGSIVNTVESHFKSDLLQEFDPSITYDNLKEGTSGAGVGGRRSSAMPPETYAHRQPCGVTVKLAAKMVSDLTSNFALISVQEKGESSSLLIILQIKRLKLHITFD